MEGKSEWREEGSARKWKRERGGRRGPRGAHLLHLVTKEISDHPRPGELNVEDKILASSKQDTRSNDDQNGKRKEEGGGEKRGADVGWDVRCQE